MSNQRHKSIDRDAIEDEESSAPVTFAQTDAALYGKLRAMDGERRNLDRARFGAFKITAIGLEIGEGAQEKDWREAGDFIFQLDSGIQWLIGDWLLYGVNLRYGDMPVWAEQFGRDASTLHTYKQMAENIEFTRRRVELSFAHHQEVRSLNPEQQDFALAHAAEEGLKRAEFRAWIKRQQGSAPELQTGQSMDAQDDSARFAPAPSDQKVVQFYRRSKGDARRLTPQERDEIERYIAQNEEHTANLKRWLAGD